MVTLSSTSDCIRVKTNFVFNTFTSFYRLSCVLFNTLSYRGETCFSCYKSQAHILARITARSHAHVRGRKIPCKEVFHRGFV